MLTYVLFKTQSMLLSGTSKKRQSDADLHTVQNPEHDLVSNKREGPARCWLTICSKPRAWSFQQQAGRASQMLTYTLCKTQSMILSATSRKGQPDADLHPVQTQSIILSATSRKGQPYADLHPVWNPEDDPVSNKQEGPARCWLTSCSKLRAYSFSNKQEGPARCWHTSYSKPRAWSYQQQAGRATQMLTYILFKTQSILLQQQAGRVSQMLTYSLFKTQSMLLSATSRKSQPDADLLAIQNPEHALVSNKQEGPARCWLTICSKPRACSYEQQVGRARQMLTDILFKNIIPYYNQITNQGSHTKCGKYLNISLTISLFLLNSFQPEDRTLLF